MTRLLIHVEGQTEETFVREVLREHLCNRGFDNVSARLLGNARQRSSRGGVKPWTEVRRDILGHLRGDGGCIATTMVDFYGLPAAGEGAWPGRDAANSRAFANKASEVEAALSSDIGGAMGPGFDNRRFVPFVIMHEFEGILFSDCPRFARGIGHPELAPKFQNIRDQFGSPEEINDSPVTAPSKRVQDLVPNYEKPLQGTLAVLEIGLAAIVRECANFANWLVRLEASLAACH